VKKVIKQLTKLANHLDAKGLRKEADAVDVIIKKIAALEAWEVFQEYSDSPTHEGDEPAANHYVEESYAIGNGYCQLKLSTGEQYIFQCEDLPDFSPGAQVSEDEVDQAYDSNLLEGDGTYTIPDDFLKEKGNILNEPLDSTVPDGSLLITSISSGGKTTCYYKLNERRFKVESSTGDCTNERSIEPATIRDVQR
jgi:hypothetical protein